MQTRRRIVRRQVGTMHKTRKEREQRRIVSQDRHVTVTLFSLL